MDDNEKVKVQINDDPSNECLGSQLEKLGVDLKKKK